MSVFCFRVAFNPLEFHGQESPLAAEQPIEWLRDNFLHSPWPFLSPVARAQARPPAPGMGFAAASGWAGVRPISVSKFASWSLKALLSLSEMANDLRDSKGSQYDMTMELQV